MIPKTVHYIWLGGKPKSAFVRMCINTWRRNLDGYQIVEWNESNLPLEELSEENCFLKECLRLRLWAFASDYLRLFVLERYGGIYLDTDVEILSSFDRLLGSSMFVGLEANGYICTGVIGARANSPEVKRLREYYEHEVWESPVSNNPVIFRDLMKREPEHFSGCRVLPQAYFAPYELGMPIDSTIGKPETIAIHWYSGNWNMSLRGYVFLNTKHISRPIPKFVESCRKTIGYFRQRYLKG